MKRILFLLMLVPICVLAQEPDADYFKIRIIDQVAYYNGEMDRLGKELNAARANKSVDTITLDKAVDEVVAKCYQVPQGFIKEFPSSPLSIDALKMLGDASWAGSPVKLAHLESLFAGLSTEVKTSAIGKEYAAKLKSYYWLNKLRKSVGDMKSISVKETLLELATSINGKASIGTFVPLKVKIAEEPLMDKIKAATLIVSMAYKKGKKTEINPATAYVIDESGICVTNYHVGKEYSSKELYKSLSVMTAEGKVYPATKILSCSESDDLLVFQVDTKGDKLSALPLGYKLAEGQPVHVMGHPLGKFYQFTSGKVSGYSTSTLAGKPCNIMSITADFNIGSSGGPIVDDYGNVMGTVSRIDGGMKVGIPVSELKKLLVMK